MTALVMQKLADVLAKEGFVIKKIEDEERSSTNNGEKYTGNIIIKVRPADEEEAEAEIVRLRKLKQQPKNKPETKPIKTPQDKPTQEKPLIEKYDDIMKEIGSVLTDTDSSGNFIFNLAEQNEAKSTTKAELAKIKKPEDKYKYICDFLFSLKNERQKKIDILNKKKLEQTSPSELQPATAVSETKDNIAEKASANNPDAGNNPGPSSELDIF